MPGGSIASAIQLLERGANPRYKDAYDRHYEAATEKLSQVMDLGIPSDKSIELMSYMLAQPHARAWADGEAIPEGASQSRSFNVVNRPYGLRLPVREADATFDQVGYLLQSIANGGKSLAWIKERVFFQLLLGSVDLDLLPAVPNAADGAALHSLTDGSGAARFGVATVAGSGGNIRSGSGVASVAAVISDFQAALGQAQRWQDGQGQPLFTDDVFEAPVVWIAGAHNRLVYNQALKQSFVFQTSGGAAAAPSNLLKDASQSIKPWLTQRVPAGNDDSFLFLTGTPKKSLVETIASPIRYLTAKPENSDWCRTWRAIYFQWDMIAGYGIGEAYATIKIDN